eukprot:jgi/Psemu1/45731/gm1.45731_g
MPPINDDGSSKSASSLLYYGDIDICMSDKVPPNIPIAKRTRSSLSLGHVSIHEVNHTPREGFLSLQPQSSARKSLFQGDNDNMTSQQDDTMTDNKDDLFPLFDNTASHILQDILNIDKEAQDMTCEALVRDKYTTWNEFLQLTPEFIADLTYRDGKTRIDWKNPLHHTKAAFDAYRAPIISALCDTVVDCTNLLTPQGNAPQSKSPEQLETKDIDTHTFLNPSWPHAPLSGFRKELYDKQCAFFWTNTPCIQK